MNNLKSIIRNAIKNKGITSLNILGLTAGFVCSILLVSWVIHESTFDSFVKDKDKIYRIYLSGSMNGEVLKSGGCVPGVATYAAEFLPEVDKGLRLRQRTKTVIKTDDNNFFRVNGFAADSTFFELFPFKVLAGDGKKALSVKNSIIIDKKLAAQCFGEELAIGKTLFMDEQNYTVEAVLDDLPTNSHIQFQYLIPTLNLDNNWHNNQWGMDNAQVYVTLNTTDNISAIDSKITEALYERSGMFEKMKINLTFQAIKEIPFDNSFKWDYARKASKKNIYILSIVAFFIMFIACINFTNLFISTAIKRKKAVGVKVTNGAAKKSIIKEYLGEVLSYVLLSFLLALVIVKILLPYFNILAGAKVEINLFSIEFFSLALILIILTTAMAGIFPGIYLTRVNITEVLKGSKTGGAKGNTQKILVTSQFIIATVLLFAMITIIKQVNYLQTKDLGFEKENILYVYTDGELRFPKTQQNLKNELLQSPFINKIAYRGTIPTEFNTGTVVSLSSGEEEHKLHMEEIFVDNDFFELMNYDFVEGENIFAYSHDSLRYCIINEKAAELLNLSRPYVNNVVYSTNNNGNAYTIKGVIKDVNTKSLTEEIYPCIYTKPRWYNLSSILMFKVQDNPSMAINTIKAYWEKEFSNIPFEYQFLDDTYNALYKSEEKTKNIISWFTAIALILTSLGLLAMVHFITENRTKEIGIRKVNGAKVSEILTMLNRDFIKWVAIAFVVACPIAYYAMNKWLENFAYKTTLSWWIFTLAGVLALGIALLTVSWQSWRAATRNPVEALRYE